MVYVTLSKVILLRFMSAYCNACVDMSVIASFKCVTIPGCTPKMLIWVLTYYVLSYYVLSYYVLSYYVHV
jgi:hypothetical protein